MPKGQDESSKVQLQVPATARAGVRLNYRLVNNSPREVLAGSDFGLNVEGTGGWESVNLRMAFTAVGFLVAPGESREFTAPLPDDLPPARYQLHKSFRWSRTQGGPPPFRTTATFLLTDD